MSGKNQAACWSLPSYSEQDQSFNLGGSAFWLAVVGGVALLISVLVAVAFAIQAGRCKRLEKAGRRLQSAAQSAAGLDSYYSPNAFPIYTRPMTQQGQVEAAGYSSTPGTPFDSKPMF